MQIADIDDPRELVAGLLTKSGQENPFPWYARLREVAPIYYSEVFGNYLLTRYRDCNDVLISANIGKADAEWADTAMPRWRERPTSRYLFASMLRLNPPAHTRVRGLVNRAFTERTVASMRPRIEQIVDNVLDDLADAGAGGSVVDLQEVVGYPMTTSIMGSMVGLSEADNALFRRLVGEIARILDPDMTPAELEIADQATVEIQKHFAELIDERTVRPRDDLVSALIAVRDADGDRLSLDEMQATLALLFLAGLDTSALTIGTGMFAFLTHPGQIAALRADPSLAGTAAEEVMRWDTAAQVAHRRVLRDSEFGGVRLPEGATISVMLGAANRDPEMFTNPDAFDITRKGPRTLSFGAGIHYCIGSAVARLEGSVFFPRIFQRFPDLALAEPPERRNTVAIRGFHRIPVLTNS